MQNKPQDIIKEKKVMMSEVFRKATSNDEQLEAETDNLISKLEGMQNSRQPKSQLLAGTTTVHKLKLM